MNGSRESGERFGVTFPLCQEPFPLSVLECRKRTMYCDADCFLMAPIKILESLFFFSRIKILLSEFCGEIVTVSGHETLKDATS